MCFGILRSPGISSATLLERSHGKERLWDHLETKKNSPAFPDASWASSRLQHLSEYNIMRNSKTSRTAQFSTVSIQGQERQYEGFYIWLYLVWAKMWVRSHFCAVFMGDNLTVSFDVFKLTWSNNKMLRIYLKDSFFVIWTLLKYTQQIISVQYSIYR